MKLLSRIAASSILLTLLVFLVTPLAVLAASEGPNSPDTGENDASIGSNAWSNPTRVTASDNSRATAICAQTSPSATNYLKATDFDFAIPSGATINGIVVEVEGNAPGAGTSLVEFATVKLVKGGVIGGNDVGLDTRFPAAESYTSFGSSTELWGLTWTDTDINATNFGFAFNCQGGDGLGSDAPSIDHMRITVHYTAGGAPAVQRRSNKVIDIIE